MWLVERKQKEKKRGRDADGKESRRRGDCGRGLLGELDVERAAAVINVATLRPIIQYHADRCQ